MPAASGEELPSFEEIYARAGDDLESVPWARLAPHPLLVMWLNARPAPAAQPPALVVACGLGDDAEELAHRGYEVTAFDVSATAIAQCRRRFPASRVRYQVADVLALPEAMTRRYSLVVEINTLQSLPRPDRPRAVAAIAGAVAPGGLLFVRCQAGSEGEPDAAERPWPVWRSELAGFTTAGLIQADLIDRAPVPAQHPFLRVIYQRPADLPAPG